MGINIFLAVIAGFTAGCSVTTIIALYIYTNLQKNLEEHAENRRIVVNTIGKLSATIENAFSAYRIGTMNFDSLRQVLLSKIDEINTTLRSNMEYLDSFYVKNMERFIEDQKAFILRNQGDQSAADAPKARSVSRATVTESKGTVQQKLPSAFAPPKEEPAQEAVFEVKQPTETPVEMDKTVEIPKIPLPKPIETPVEMDKTVEISKTPLPEPTETAQKDYKSEALSAFELGATTRIPLDAIKQYQQQEEEPEPPLSSAAQTQILDKQALEPKESPVVPQFDAEAPVPQDSIFNLEDVRFGDPASTVPPPATEDDLPVKGKPVFESALDVEATQVFSVDELMQKSPSRFAPEHKGPAESPADQEPGGTESVKNANLSKGPTEGKPGTPKKKGKDDDSLITGEDVMDQMDNFFGFSE